MTRRISADGFVNVSLLKSITRGPPRFRRKISRRPFYPLVCPTGFPQSGQRGYRGILPQRLTITTPKSEADV
jgi:hypothetical protein